MTCKLSVRTRNPDGSEEEKPLDEAMDEASVDEDWNEVSRETQEIDVDGTKVDRIVRVTFEKPSGKTVRLNFSEVL